ncbi:MAG: DUF4395 domain-containing protein [Pseudonocardiaceae bacterium]
MTQSHSVDPRIDPRGPRFAAWVTTAVLVIVLVTGSTVLLAAQAIVFAVGAFTGLQLHPYGLIYRTFVAPRLDPPTEWEDPAPVRFAQGVGVAFAVIGTIGYATGLTALALTVTALALGAAFLNAAFALCLGCEIYLRLPATLRSRRGISAEPGEVAGSSHGQPGGGDL